MEVLVGEVEQRGALEDGAGEKRCSRLAQQPWGSSAVAAASHV